MNYFLIDPLFILIFWNIFDFFCIFCDFLESCAIYLILENILESSSLFWTLFYSFRIFLILCETFWSFFLCNLFFSFWLFPNLMHSFWYFETIFIIDISVGCLYWLSLQGFSKNFSRLVSFWLEALGVSKNSQKFQE